MSSSLYAAAISWQLRLSPASYQLQKCPVKLPALFSECYSLWSDSILCSNIVVRYEKAIKNTTLALKGMALAKSADLHQVNRTKLAVIYASYF